MQLLCRRMYVHKLSSVRNINSVSFLSKCMPNNNNYLSFRIHSFYRLDNITCCIKIHLYKVLLKFVRNYLRTLTSSTVPTCYITHGPPPASIIPVPYWTFGRITSQFQFNPVCVELYVNVDALNAKKFSSLYSGYHMVNSPTIGHFLHLLRVTVQRSYPR